MGNSTRNARNARALTGAGICTAFAFVAFLSFRGGLFTRGAAAEFARPAVAPGAMDDGVIEVPGEALSLAAALDFAPSGATVRLAAGTFAGPAECVGKSILIEGAGTDGTVVRGFGAFPALSFRGSAGDRVTVRGMTVLGAAAGLGAGIEVEGMAFEVRDVRFSGNRGSGASLAASHGEFVNCTFEGNRAPGSGGAVRNDGGRARFVGCSFRGNVSDAFGGAVFSRGGSVELLACTLEDNATHSGAWGGAVFGQDAAFELHGTDFLRNRSIESGGAVYLMGGIADVSRCSFSGNSSSEARSIFSRGAGVRVAASRLCGLQEVAVGGDLALDDGNVFDPACHGDCNQNGVADGEEIELGWAPDRDSNGMPDSCDPDCNSNGMPDGYEIAAGFAADANVNGLVDLCEIRAGLALDVDNDWIPDDAQVPAMAGALPGAEGVPAAYAAPAGAAVPEPFDPWANMPRYGMRP
jgi:hypothetical protein